MTKFSNIFNQSTAQPIVHSFRVMSHNKAPTFAIIALSTLSFIADGLALVSIVPIFEIIQNGQLSQSPNAMNSIFHWIADLLGINLTVISLLILATSFFIIKIVIKLIADLGMAAITISFGTKLRFRMLSAISAAKWQYFKSQSVGQFANAITTEASKSSGIFRYGIELIFAVIQFSVLAAFAITLSWKLSILFFLAALLSILIATPFSFFTKVAVVKQSVSLNTISDMLIDWLNGIKPVKSMNLGRNTNTGLEESFDILNKANFVQAASKATLRHITDCLAILTIVGAVMINEIYVNAEISLVSGAVLLFYRASGVLNISQGVLQSLINCDRFYASLTKRLEQAESNAEKNMGKIEPSDVKYIELKRLNFTFGKRRIFSDVNVVFNRGEITLITGPSGSGKSTLIDLITGLLRASDGKILVDGTEIEKINLNSWRKIIGYVAQEMFLQNDTVRNNVTMGRSEIEDHVVLKALNDAGLDEDFDAGNLTLDQSVGEKGSNLSGGQRQRVALARGLVGKPQILILDEFTSSMDSDTEKQILERIKSMCSGMIVILISHQATIIPFADKIVKVQDGKILS